MSPHIYAPSLSGKLKPRIAEILTEEWVNTASICAALKTWSDDHNVRIALRSMAKAGIILCKVVPGRSPAGFTYHYRKA